VFVRLKVLKKSDDVLVSRLLQDDDFLEDLASLDVVAEVLFVDRFYCHHLVRQVVQGQIHLSEGALAQDLADSVKVDGGKGHRTRVLIAQTNVLGDPLSYLLF